jgi:hypothetical protein
MRTGGTARPVCGIKSYSYTGVSESVTIANLNTLAPLSAAMFATDTVQGAPHIRCWAKAERSSPVHPMVCRESSDKH